MTVPTLALQPSEAPTTRTRSARRRATINWLGGLAALSVVVVGLLPATSHAAGRPSAACAEAFTLQNIDDFGPGFQAFLARVDKNGDRLVCTLLLPDALPFAPINFVDNVARA